MADNTTDLIRGVSFRPKIYITLQASKGTYNVKSGNWTYYDDAGEVTNDAKKVDIGAVQSLEINSTRDVQVWRELNYLTAGKPIESYPGLSSYELSMSRIVLYDTNYLEALGFEGHDILKQNRPLTIHVAMKDPEGKNDKAWDIYGVWFKDNPMEFEIDDISDLRILQDVTAIAAGIVAAPKSATPTV